MSEFIYKGRCKKDKPSYITFYVSLFSYSTSLSNPKHLSQVYVQPITAPPPPSLPLQIICIFRR
ncbi:hypothetical protein HanRHA438_Chr06g0259721 [Helianthus annuus]|uniref:Uncharacterized protein n=1 Tax=Helianthus annuus TaxID=4232 RepID=A0A251UGR9_HELAN|nr:hypothetical protein HanXRQr2_Chr06g0250401 [Helianthus annuus]KAJ0566052.1 hypothetical protein HanIR_Chr06g0269511 [Helianthus annuus]KAJ0911113.1 hypothetical protein HanRHA438_Chr06g0259721 [Helianthus annuus]